MDILLNYQYHNSPVGYKRSHLTGDLIWEAPILYNSVRLGYIA